jgi:hypothetical protein
MKTIGTDILKAMQLISGSLVEKKKWWAPPWGKKDAKDAEKTDGKSIFSANIVR